MDGTQQLSIVVERFPRSRRTFALCCALVLVVAASAGYPKSMGAQERDLVLTNVAEAQLDSLASRVAVKMKKLKREHNPSRILVFDFTRDSQDKSSLLGALLADRFADMLKHNSDGMDVLDRDLLKNYLKKLQTNIEDLRTNSVYLQIAEDLGRQTRSAPTSRRTRTSN